jgi:hypothetical protein
MNLERRGQTALRAVRFPSFDVQNIDASRGLSRATIQVASRGSPHAWHPGRLIIG